MFRWEEHDISLKTYLEQELNPHDRQRQLQSATLLGADPGFEKGGGAGGSGTRIHKIFCHI